MTSVFGTKSVPSTSFLLAQTLTAILVVVVIRAMVGFNDASSALGFYGVYHREPWNQLIHFIGVPLILYTIFIFTAFLPLPLVGQYGIKIPLAAQHSMTWATLIIVMYLVFYLTIDTIGAILYAPFLYLMYVTAVNLVAKDKAGAQKNKQDDDNDNNVNWMGTGKLLKYALCFHLLAWYIQIHPGHAIIEGAKPALMDSLGGALTSAPLFAFYEGVWLLGINRGLQEQTNRMVAEYTAELCAAGASMRACATL